MVHETPFRNMLSSSAMESMIEIRNDQPKNDRLRYFNTALEGSAETNATLLQKLYQDIISKSAIDFGQIPDSQGALVKYKDYHTMEEAMDCINKLFVDKQVETVDMMNQLHDFIINLRKDYAFGYQFDIDIIKIIYCTSVVTLMELINVNIVSYTKGLRITPPSIRYKVKKNDLLIIKSAKALIRSYESGEWNRILNVMKKDPALRGAAIEAKNTVFSGIVDSVKDLAGEINTVVPAMTKIGVFLRKYKNIGAIAAAAIAIFLAIRKLIYYFFRGRQKVSDWLRTEKEFIDAVTKEERDSLTNNMIEKRQKIANRLERTADMIEVKLDRVDAEAKRDLIDSNKKNFSKASFSNSGVGGDITF